MGRGYGECGGYENGRMRGRGERGELACGTIDSWLLFRLTAGELHVTDVSNASRTLLMNLERCDWDDELLKLFRVPRAMLPEIRSSSEIYGHVADSLPLAGIAIGGVAGDQHAALFGQTCFARGDSKNTYGTGCFLLMNVGKQPRPSKHRLLSTMGWRVGEETTYALEGSVFIAGAAVAWLRDGLGIIESSSQIEELARSVPDNGGVYFVPALAGLGAPHWDPPARGAIVGLSGGTTAGHLARATLEGIALEIADLVEAIRQDSGESLDELRVDGGASVNDLLLQHQADVLQCPVVRPKITETTALGAAYLAGLAAGVWSDRQEIAGQWRVDKVFEPHWSAEQAAQHRRQWARAVERAKGWAED